MLTLRPSIKKGSSAYSSVDDSDNSRGQEPRLYVVSLEDHVPAKHRLPGIGRFLDSNDLHQHLARCKGISSGLSGHRFDTPIHLPGKNACRHAQLICRLR